MGLKFTPEQDRAIGLRGENILVSAAAGSGKTALLTERLARLVLGGETDVSRLLVVTFTRAAAREMKERFRKRLFEALRFGDPCQKISRQELGKQIAKLENAQFSTMDAFNNRLVREYFQHTSLAPNFRIGEDAELRLLKAEAIEETLEEVYGSDKEELKQLSDLYGTFRSDQNLRNLIDAILRFQETLVDPEAWRDEHLAEMENQKGLTSPVYQAYEARLRADLKYAISQTEVMIERYQDENPKGDAGPFLPRDLEFYEKIAGLDSLEAMIRAIGPKPSFARANFPRKDFDPDVKEAIKTRRDSLKEIFKPYGILAPFLDEEEGRMHEMAGRLSDLMELTRRAGEKFEEKKRERGLADFAQVSREVLGLLGQEEVADEIRSRFDLIFFDEYQDTNGVQEAIIERIARPGGRFMVGDLKQSIYRFRKADPEIFIDKYHRYQDQGEGALVLLNRNFRSAPEVIGGINALFESVMSEEIGDITYDDDAKLIPGREDLVGEKPQLHLITRGDQTEMSEAQVEALACAKIIKETMAEHPQMHFRDIAILQRNANAVSQEMVEVLSQSGIPVISESEREFFESVEVRTVLDLLSIIDNLYQDLPLLSVMHSPIGAFSLEEESQIRLESDNRRKAAGERRKPGDDLPFYQALLDYETESEDEKLREKVRGFLSQLRAWREEAPFETTDAFIWRLIRESGYDVYVRALDEGKVRMNNLRILVERAETYEKSSYKGISHFLQYVSRLRRRQQQITGGQSQADTPDAVTLMTVHKSKGLEYPMILLTGAGKNFNTRETRDALLLHRQYGFGTDYLYLGEELTGSAPTIEKEAFKQVIRRESLSEEMRLLYVALTRAERMLHVIGTVKEKKSKGEPAKIPVKKGLDSVVLGRANAYLDWIMPAVLTGEEVAPGDLPSIPGWSAECLEGASLEVPEGAEVEAYHPNASPEMIEKVGKVLMRSPHERLRIPTKLSVSSLKQSRSDAKGEADAIDEVELPVFGQTGEISEAAPGGAEQGTLIHSFLERADLEVLAHAAKDGKLREAIADQIDRMVEKGWIGEDEREAVEAGLVERFLVSPLGTRILDACLKDPDNFLREYSTLLLIPAELADPVRFAGSGRSIELQGVIDLCFREGDDWILVDYKTDQMGRLPAAMQKERMRAYRTQAALYRRSIEELTGERVKEAYLAFLREGVNVPVAEDLLAAPAEILEEEDFAASDNPADSPSFLERPI